MESIVKRKAYPDFPTEFGPATPADLAHINSYIDSIQNGFSDDYPCQHRAIRLGSVRVALQGPNLDAALNPSPYRDFLHHREKNPAMQIYFRLRPFNLKISDGFIYDSIDGFEFFSGPMFSLFLDTQSWKAWGFVREMAYTGLDKIIRLCTVLYAVRHNSLFVHGCALNYKQRGYLFTGSSGSGKTTLANSSDKFFALNDEMIMVDCSGGHPVLYGTPFSGTSMNSICRPGRVRATGLMFLKQASCDRLESVPPLKAWMRLGKTVFYPQFVTHFIENLLDIGMYLTERVPAYEMCFTKGDRFLNVLDENFDATESEAVSP